MNPASIAVQVFLVIVASFALVAAVHWAVSDPWCTPDNFLKRYHELKEHANRGDFGPEFEEAVREYIYSCIEGPGDSGRYPWFHRRAALKGIYAAAALRVKMNIETARVLDKISETR